MADQTGNLFLDALSPELRRLLVNGSVAVTLPIRTPLSDSNKRSRYGYFLTSGIASTVVVTPDGEAAEVGVQGREGVVGSLQLLGQALYPTECMMQLDGWGFRIEMDVLQRTFDSSTEIRTQMLALVQVNALTTSQMAGCHALHESTARLSRWLLMVQDRTGLSVLNFTQEFLAQMLGARRTTVTMIAGAMQQSGLIEYRRGRITILDREQLREAACNCYSVSKTLLDGLIPPDAPSGSSLQV